MATLDLSPTKQSQGLNLHLRDTSQVCNLLNHSRNSLIFVFVEYWAFDSNNVVTLKIPFHEFAAYLYYFCLLLLSLVVRDSVLTIT